MKMVLRQPKQENWIKITPDACEVPCTYRLEPARLIDERREAKWSRTHPPLYATELTRVRDSITAHIATAPTTNIHYPTIN